MLHVCLVGAGGSGLGPCTFPDRGEPGLCGDGAGDVIRKRGSCPSSLGVEGVGDEGAGLVTVVSGR